MALIAGATIAGMTTTATPPDTAFAAGEGERIWIVGDTMTLKATGESTDGGLAARSRT